MTNSSDDKTKIGKTEIGKTEIDDALVRSLAGLLDELNLGEIEYAAGDWRVRVARNTAGPPAAVPAPAPGPEATPAEAAAAEAPPEGAVTSPMVGTAYLAPEPGAANFVAVGDRVSEGQTVMLVEAMKTYNEIRAPRAGEVAQILIENATPVEYGDVLLVIA
jgi:acetyl-CoA carboxylase biotin carboxyl carrier protein